MCAQKHDISDGLNEEYYQISPDILTSFNKYRPPLNIYMFMEDVARVAPYYKVGGRLSNEQVEELAAKTKEGLIFVSRDDHPVYVKHISYQLDLVLVDKNLKERETADIFAQAFARRLEEVMDQPVPVVLEKFWVDLMVLTEYLFTDIHRARALARRLTPEHTLGNHSMNCGFLGLALYGKMQAKNFEEGGVKRKSFDRLAAGFFLHDIGMTKIPSFIPTKEKPLTTDERMKINQHPKLGYEMLSKLDLKYPEIEQCVLEHHERMDGSGYPQKKTDSSLPGKLCAVVDAFCAMTSDRAYAKAMPKLQAAAQLSKAKGFSSTITAALQSLLIQDLKLKE